MERIRQVISGLLIALLIPLMGAKQWEVGSRSVYHASGGGITITPIGTAACYSTVSGGATSLTTGSYTATTGSTILLAVDMLASSIPAPGMVDSGTYNTYMQPSAQIGVNSYYYAAMFGALSNSHSGSMTFTASPLISGAGSSICIQEYSGPVAAFGNTNTCTGDSNTYSCAVTTQDPNNYVACSISQYGQPASLTATSGTIRVQTSADNGGAIQDNHSATAGSVTVAGTIPSSGYWAMTCVELRTV